MPAIRLHARRLIDGPLDRAIPLVLLHGFTGDATTWADLAAHLGSARPLLALDLVGHGRSPAPDDPAAYTMAATVAAVVATIDGLGIARAHWLGYSMGGRVAIHLALARPARVASLALVGTSPGLDDPAARAERVRADAALADLVEREGIAAFVDRWMAKPLFASQARLGAPALARARAQRLRNRPHALAHTLRGMGTGAMAPVTERLAEITVPVLLIAGAEDAKFTDLAVRMATRLEHAEVQVVPGAGHAVQAEAPARLGALVEAFLGRVEGGGENR